MKFNLSQSLPDNEYNKTVTPKTQIVLHHTVSSTGQYVGDWFRSDNGKSKVATAFVIDKDGTIYQLFDPKYWAWHIGKSSTQKHNQQSIGIELANEGLLTQHIVGTQKRYFWFDGKHQYKGGVIKLPIMWRGSYFFAPYTAAQFRATVELVEYLCKEFNIPKEVICDYEYNKAHFDHKGIVSHHNLRPDKSDVSPAFRLELLQEILRESK